MDTQIVATTMTAVPIILLILSGVIIRRVGIISPHGIEELKKIVVNVALPAVLFRAFLTIQFESRYLGIFVFMPIILFGLLGGGYLFRTFVPRWRTTPFLMTGFEFGMLGISLFGTAYGMDQIGAISVVGLPHELFIWFVYVTLMRIQFGGSSTIGGTLRSFLTSPVIVAILSGTVLNLVGLSGWFTTALVPAAFLETLSLLGGIVGPLILLIIGYGTRISLAGLRQALPLVGVRFVVVLAIGLFVVPTVIEGILGLAPIFTYAVFTFIILPPPFIVPLFTPAEEREEMAYINNVLSVYTLFSIVMFLIYFATHPLS